MPEGTSPRAAIAMEIAVLAALLWLFAVRRSSVGDGALALALVPLFFAFRSLPSYFAFLPWLALYAANRHYARTVMPPASPVVEAWEAMVTRLRQAHRDGRAIVAGQRAPGAGADAEGPCGPTDAVYRMPSNQSAVPSVAARHCPAIDHRPCRRTRRTRWVIVCLVAGSFAGVVALVIMGRLAIPLRGQRRRRGNGYDMTNRR